MVFGSSDLDLNLMASLYERDWVNAFKNQLERPGHTDRETNGTERITTLLQLLKSLNLTMTPTTNEHIDKTDSVTATT